MMKALTYQNRTAGEFFENERIFVFFGQRHLSAADLPEAFPQFQFRYVKQVHGDQCVQASALLKEADAQWAKARGLAIPVQTADCLPILAWDPDNSWILSIHAGWRGLANEITVKSLAALKPSANLQVWLGPHIGPSSFEVQKDVAEQLAQVASQYTSDSILNPHTDPEKYYVDLTRLSLLQLESCGIARDKIWVSDQNTFADARYHSWRRDRTTGRQWSFIALK